MVQYFYISAQEEDDAGTAGVLSGGDYTWGPGGLGPGASALGLVAVKVELGFKNASNGFASYGGQ